MSIIRNFDTLVKTQTYTIKTDIETNYPSLSCPLTCNFDVNPCSSYVTQTGTTISVNPVALMLTSDSGAKTIKIKCDSTDFPSTVTDVVYSFLLNIEYCVVDTFTIEPIANKSMVIATGSQTMNFNAATFSNLACDYSITYSASYYKNGISLVPSFISFDASNRQFIINPTASSHVGVYEVTVTASIPQLSIGPAGVKTVSTSFIITVQNDCPPSVMSSPTFTNMSTIVTVAATQSLALTNSKAVAYADPMYCGLNKYVFTPSLPTFLSFNPATPQVLTLFSNLVTDVNLSPLSL
jgi:hypothetical protein